MPPQDEDESENDSVTIELGSNRKQSAETQEMKASIAGMKAVGESSSHASSTPQSPSRSNLKTPSCPKRAAAAPTLSHLTSSDARRPTTHDVRCGRGIPIHNYPGNAKFHAILNSHREEYRRIPRADKSSFIKRIVREVKQKGLRFLNRKSKGGGDDNSCTSGEEDEWEVMDDAFIYEKISHGLRRRDQHTPTSKTARDAAVGKTNGGRMGAENSGAAGSPSIFGQGIKEARDTPRTPGLPAMLSIPQEQGGRIPSRAPTDIGRMLGFGASQQSMGANLLSSSLFGQSPQLSHLANTFPHQTQQQQQYQPLQQNQYASANAPSPASIETLLRSITNPPAPTPPRPASQSSLQGILSTLLAQQQQQQQQGERERQRRHASQEQEQQHRFTSLLLNLLTSNQQSSNQQSSLCSGALPATLSSSMHYPPVGAPLSTQALQSLLPTLFMPPGGSGGGGPSQPNLSSSSSSSSTDDITKVLLCLLQQAAPSQASPPLSSFYNSNNNMGKSNNRNNTGTGNHNNDSASALNSVLYAIASSREGPAPASVTSSSAPSSGDLQSVHRALQDAIAYMNRSSGDSISTQDRKDNDDTTVGGSDHIHGLQ